MSGTVVPLSIFPWPTDASGAHARLTPERSAMLRAAKKAIDVPFLIQPEPFAPGGPGRALGWGAVPDAVCECVIIPAHLADDQDTITRALRVLLTASSDHPGVVTREKWLSVVMGVEVTYLGEEEVAPEPSRVAFGPGAGASW